MAELKRALGFWTILALSITSIMGTGMFFGAALGASYSGNASIISWIIISIIAVLLGLLAATTGGSFDSDDDGFLLLLSFCFIAMFGFALVIFNKSLKLEADIAA